MNIKLIRSAVVAVIALGGGFGASAALAQAGYPGATYQGDRHAEQDGYVDQETVPYDRFGHFSCSDNERHTRLERKACGGTTYRY